VLAGEVGHAPGELAPAVLAVVRGGRRYSFDDREVAALRQGDRVVQVQGPQRAGDAQTGVQP
jgi:hypothetical protein